MPKPSIQKYRDTRLHEINLVTTLSRVFRKELKKLRSLPSPQVNKHWWDDNALTVSYKAKLLNMRDAAKWLSKFLLIVEGEELSSTDSPSAGTRTFTCTYKKGDYKLILLLEVDVFTQDENPLSNCRKVQIGVDTHTYTSTTPRYELVCD